MRIQPAARPKKQLHLGIAIESTLSREPFLLLARESTKAVQSPRFRRWTGKCRCVAAALLHAPALALPELAPIPLPPVSSTFMAAQSLKLTFTSFLHPPVYTRAAYCAASAYPAQRLWALCLFVFPRQRGSVTLGMLQSSRVDDRIVPRFLPSL